MQFNQNDLLAIRRTIETLAPSDRESVTMSFMRRLTLDMERLMKKEILSGQVLKTRTGRLRSSFNSLVGRIGNDVVGVVGSGVRSGARVSYADIHETGGVIRPKRAKWLTIPLRDALTKSGSQLRGGALRARDFKNTFFMRTKNGNLLLMQRKTKKKNIALFVLKKSVTIPARHYMTKGVALMKDRTVRIFTEVLDKHFKNRGTEK